MMKYNTTKKLPLNVIYFVYYIQHRSVPMWGQINFEPKIYIIPFLKELEKACIEH